MEWYEIVLYFIAALMFIGCVALFIVDFKNPYGGSVPPPPIKRTGETMSNKSKEKENEKHIAEYIALIVLAAVIIALLALMLGKASPAHAQSECPPGLENCMVIIPEIDTCPEPGTPQCEPIAEPTPPPNQEDIPCGELHSLCAVKPVMEFPAVELPQIESAPPVNETLINADDDKPQRTESPAESLPCDDFWRM